MWINLPEHIQMAREDSAVAIVKAGYNEMTLSVWFKIGHNFVGQSDNRTQITSE